LINTINRSDRGKKFYLCLWIRIGVKASESIYRKKNCDFNNVLEEIEEQDAANVGQGRVLVRQCTNKLTKN